MMKKLPPWLHQKLPSTKNFAYTKDLVQKFHLNTVCEEAKCPNRFFCFEKKRATFLALGKSCSRKCAFCDINNSQKLLPPDKEEPLKIALLTKELQLKHVVITMVTRDDLPDGGSTHIAEIIRETKKINPNSIIEVLTSDFEGKEELLDKILLENPHIFNHNIETVASLSPTLIV